MAASALSLSVDGDGVFERGQTVTGTVTVNAAPPDDAKELTVKLVGTGEVKWVRKTKDHSYNVGTAEGYIDVKDSLWTPSSGIVLHAGLEFPFRFELPDDLPPSMKVPAWAKLKVGYIKYTVQAELDHGSQAGHTDITQATDITVVAEATVPDESSSQPVRISQEHTLKTCCCTSGTVVTDLSIPKKILFPGETVLISGEIRNQSSTTIKQTTARLSRCIMCRAGRWNRNGFTVAATVDNGPVEPQSVKRWDGIALTVPVDVIIDLPSDLGPKCKIFTVKNSVVVILDPSGAHFDMTATADVQLGVVSRRNDAQGGSGTTIDEFVPDADDADNESEPVLDIEDEANDDD